MTNPIEIGPYTLSIGQHSDPSKGMRVMEMVSFLAGEEWSDTPVCASPVVAIFCQVINDRLGQGFRDKLQRYVPRLIGTASPEHDQARAEYLAWQAITVFAPVALRAAGLHDQAQALAEFDRDKGLHAAAHAAAAAYAAYAADSDRAAAAAAAYAAYAADSDRAAAAARAAAHAAADADRAAAAAADVGYAARAAGTTAARANIEELIFQTLDGLLEIGPSGQSYQPAHVERAGKLSELVGA